MPDIDIFNVTIALDILYTKKEKIYPAYVSKHNLNHEETNYFNNSKWGKITLSCSQKAISIIERKNF